MSVGMRRQDRKLKVGSAEALVRVRWGLDDPIEGGSERGISEGSTVHVRGWEVCEEEEGPVYISPERPDSLRYTAEGPLMGGPQCRMSILRNGHVTFPCHLFSPMSHVEFKKRLCSMSV